MWEKLKEERDLKILAYCATEEASLIGSPNYESQTSYSNTGLKIEDLTQKEIPEGMHRCPACHNMFVRILCDVCNGKGALDWISYARNKDKRWMSIKGRDLNSVDRYTERFLIESDCFDKDHDPIEDIFQLRVRIMKDPIGTNSKGIFYKGAMS
jgi:hypothetical protein